MTRDSSTAERTASGSVASHGLLARWTMNRGNYWLGFTLDGAVSLVVLTTGAIAANSGASVAIACMVGYVFYTFHEYVSHRWLYHGWRSTAQVMHGLHHGAPRAQYGAPFFFTLVQCATGWALASLIVGPSIAAVFAGAALLIHTCQGAVHHAMHQSRTRTSGVFARLRRHHLIHHKRDDVNFGVLTTVWDRVLGTHASETR